MKPTTDIVEELRLYNRWRRGDEAITAPDPTALGKLLDDAADRIEHLFASGIHTCHADCQRPMCVLRRERDKAHADLARVTAELEQAEQRNAELVAALDYIAKWVEADGADEKYDREILRVCALASAESATPDHIPDAAKMVSATPAKQEAAR